MSMSQHVKHQLSNIAADTVHSEMVSLQDPRVWTRLQKRKDGAGTIVRDYYAKGTTVAARVRERNGRLIDVALMDLETLHKLQHTESHTPGRAWNDTAEAKSSPATLETREFIFGMANEQYTSLPCLLITPAVYFASKGEPWPVQIELEGILPTWLKKLTAGVYQTDGRSFETVKAALLDSGFVESDALSTYHQETLELDALSVRDENNL